MCSEWRAAAEIAEQSDDLRYESDESDDDE